MKRILVFPFFLLVLAATLGFGKNPDSRAQKPSAKGEMKQSGSEVKEAGKSIGHQTRHGHVVSGGKEFGKHMGRAGKHFGHGVKRGAKHTVS